MKAMAIFGSPRKGNSEFLAEYLLQRLEEHGVETTRWHLNKMNYRGCTVCDACKRDKDECVLRDDLTPLLEAMKETDVVVLATPLYNFDTSALVKTMLERWYSYLLPMYYTGKNRQTRLPEGKQVVLIVSQGAPEDVFRDFPQRMESIFQLYNCRPAHLLRCVSANDPQTAEKDENLIAEAEKVATLVLDGKGPSTPITPYRSGV